MKDQPTPPRDELTLRIAPELKRQLEQCARENERSLNAEIVSRLRQSVTGYRT